jgi:hypothetical protein
MDGISALITFAAGLAGVVAGGLLSRRNEKKALGERLLVEALDDAGTAVAQVAGGEGRAAQTRYASALKRIALHASPSVILAFRGFQEHGTTETLDGRASLISAVQAARRELGHANAPDEDIAVLLFGHTAAGRTSQRSELSK